MNVHASLIADLMLYNYDWLYGVLESGVYEERDIYLKDTFRYTFDNNDINKLFIWTSDPKNILGKIRSIKRLGYKVEVINKINLYDSFYEPEKDNNTKILNRYLNYANKEKISICYGPIFVNNYTDINWHKGQIRYLWRRVRGLSDTIYLDFNLNHKYLDSKRLQGSPLTDKQKLDFMEFVKEVVGPRVSVLLKPSYYSLDRKTDFDFGEENFCFSRSFLNEGMNNIHTQKAKELIHYSDSRSLILKEKADENIYHRKLVDGKFQNEIQEKKEAEKRNKDILNNTNSLFEALV